VAGIARDGDVVHALTYRTVKAPGDPYGPSASLAVTPIPDLINRARALLGPVGYTGIFGIESLCTPDGVPRFIEMNTRILASFAALSSAGVDLVEDYLYALGARSEPASGCVRETGPLRVDSIRLFWRDLGLRWVAVELLLRLRSFLGKHNPFAKRAGIAP
jgi:predicted ATP-grasp superfamily ATP-dependent carboligase